MRQLLDRVAAGRGIEPGYWDIFGHYHETPDSTRQTILGAMGIAAGSAAELEASVAAAERREWERLLPPSVVAGERDEVELPLQVPAESLGERARIEIDCEDGRRERFELNLWELPRTASCEMNGHSRVRLAARLPVRLPLGYHEIRAYVGAASGATRYIVTPERAYTDRHLGRGGRAAGIALSLYGLRSERNWGAGDFRDLAEFARWAAAALDVSFIGLNPLHAIHNRRPYNTSPYLPNCIFFRNFLYLDIEGMEDYAGCARARALRESAEVSGEIEELRRAPFVEYERVAALKLRFLKMLFVHFLRERRARPERGREFDDYRAREGELLERFALYSALDEHLHRRDPELWVWPQWPAAFHDPESAETRAFARKHRTPILFYEYLQWQVDRQLRAAHQVTRASGLSIGLFHDVALATDRFGSDLWAHRPFFVSGCRVGSPPDDFSPSGQDWGFPPPDAAHHREDGYRLFAESIRKNCRHGGALRIDHVMRLFRLFWIPDGLSAAGGAYVKELSLDMVRVLALESVRNRVVVVGEDLGTVEPEVRQALERFGILSYRVFFFEKDKAGTFRDPAEYPRQALVSSTTHDLPTLRGFWEGADIEARRAAGMIGDNEVQAQSAMRAADKQKMLDALFRCGLMRPDLPRDAAAYPVLTGELHNAAIGFLARTTSQLLAINQEDLTKERMQQNLPGTTAQYPNWGRKMRFTVEELARDPEAAGCAAMVRNWIEATGRRNQREC
jgi:4-alpha-glucanotransferase